MLIIAILLAVTLILIFKEMKPEYKADKKVFWVYTLFFGLAFVLWALNGLDVKVPSFAEPLAKWLKDVFSVIK